MNAVFLRFNAVVDVLKWRRERKTGRSRACLPPMWRKRSIGAYSRQNSRPAKTYYLEGARTDHVLSALTRNQEWFFDPKLCRQNNWSLLLLRFTLSLDFCDQFPMSLRLPRSGTNLSISDSLVPAPITSSSFDSPFCSSITLSFIRGLKPKHWNSFTVVLELFQAKYHIYSFSCWKKNYSWGKLVQPITLRRLGAWSLASLPSYSSSSSAFSSDVFDFHFLSDRTSVVIARCVSL